MKKLSLFVAALFLLTRVEALPIGNPSEASLFTMKECKKECASNSEERPLYFTLGYYGDFVFNRHFKTVAGKQIDYSHITTNAGYLGLTVGELFEIFTTLGATQLSLNTSLKPFNGSNPSPRFDFFTNTAFSWSVGTHATIWHYRCFALGVMGQYFSSRPHTHLWRIVNVSGNSNDDHARYSEWQFGAGVSYRYSCYFVPYIAIKWSRALWEFNNQPLLVRPTSPPVATLINLESSRHFGYAIGLTLAPPFDCKNLAVTVEGRFGDENAIHIKGQLFF